MLPIKHSTAWNGNVMKSVLEMDKKGDDPFQFGVTGKANKIAD